MVLNPHARSWHRDPQKSSSPPEQVFEGEKNHPLPMLPCQIYDASALLTKNPTPAMFPFYLPNHFLYAASAACTVVYPVYLYYQYPGFQAYYQPVVAKDGVVMVECENDVMKKNLLDSSEELKGLLGISTVYRRGYFEDFRGKKVWRPKISDDGAHPVKRFTPLASRPKEEDFPFCNYTSVMIKNIPNQYRRSSFMEFLEKCCSANQLEYDFLYLPMDFRTGDNLGYAFVNCTSASAAKKMKQVFQGYEWGCFQTSHGTFISKKISDTAWAKIQGKDALVRRFTASFFPCDNYEYLPVVLSPPIDGSIGATSLTTVGNLRCCSRSLKN